MVETHLEGETLEGVKSIISHFESRLMEAPASGRLDYHNCFVGGFIIQFLTEKVRQLSFTDISF